MSNTQVMSARKFAVAAFSGVVALSLMLPTQLAFADYYIDGDETPRDGTVDDNGEGSGGGTWNYVAEGQQMTLVDYVGESIRAYDQDLNIQLEGDSTVQGGISVGGGDLTITGDDSKYGKDKPSVTLASNGEDGYSYAGISAYRNSEDDAEHSVTIEDANIYAEAQYASISGGGGVTIEDSGIYRGAENESTSISASNYDSEGQPQDADVLLKGSEIEATSVHATGTLTIDNTNLTVIESDEAKEWYASEASDDDKWIYYAVRAVKGIVLKGEANGEVVEYSGEYGTWYYLTTGSDDKIELKASATPAYYGTTKGMPATGDNTLPVGASLGIVALFAAALSVYSLRQDKLASGKSVK